MCVCACVRACVCVCNRRESSDSRMGYRSRNGVTEGGMDAYGGETGYYSREEDNESVISTDRYCTVVTCASKAAQVLFSGPSCRM